jgi:hypothetical protein
MKLKKQYYLYDEGGKKGHHLAGIMLKMLERLINVAKEHIKIKVLPGNKGQLLALRVPFVVPMEKAPFKILHLTEGPLTFDALRFDLLLTVDQSKWVVDRATFFTEWMLILENLRSKHRYWLSKARLEANIYQHPFKPVGADAWIFPKGAVLIVTHVGDSPTILKPETKIIEMNTNVLQLNSGEEIK